MATDERKWAIQNDGCWWKVVGGDWGTEPHPEQTVAVVPKSRVEAAEQRVRDRELEWDGWEAKYQERLVEIESLMRSIKVMDNERADLRAKLATAVEALEFYGDAEIYQQRWEGSESTGRYSGPATKDRGERARQALSEIEQGDAK